MKTLETWNPFRELDEVQNRFAPQVDITEDDNIFVFLASLVNQARLLAMFLRRMGQRSGQGPNRDCSPDEEEHLVHQETQTDAGSHQHRDPGSIHSTIVFSDSVHNFLLAES